MESKNRRSGFAVMAGLVGMIKPLLGYMLIAIVMGCIGNLMATFITVLGGYGFLGLSGAFEKTNLALVFTLLIVFAVLRGILRYAEQACNHFIAFKLLARIRHQVFAALRKLAPAKLDGNEKGNLISIITSDIELLEVFYAHTISPICIAVLTSIFMIVFFANLHPLYAIVAAAFYIFVGAVIPLYNGKKGGEKGQNYRNAFGKLNTCVLDNLYGLEEIREFAQEEERLKELQNHTKKLEGFVGDLKKDENGQRVSTDGVILFASVAMTILGMYLVNAGQVSGADAIISVIAMSSSFGPTAALSALSNNLHHTLASGNRVLDILAETPIVNDITRPVPFQLHVQELDILETLAFDSCNKGNSVDRIYFSLTYLISDMNVSFNRLFCHYRPFIVLIYPQCRDIWLGQVEHIRKRFNERGKFIESETVADNPHGVEVSILVDHNADDSVGPVDDSFPYLSLNLERYELSHNPRI